MKDPDAELKERFPEEEPVDNRRTYAKGVRAKREYLDEVRERKRSNMRA